MSQRNLYLTNTPPDEALEKYMAALDGLLCPRAETIPVVGCCGRVTSRAVYARLSSPLYNAAAMDGIAVVSARTATASESAPLLLGEGDYAVVDTGEPIYPPYDAVVMAEDCIEDGGGVSLIASAAPWQHIRPVGEDIVAGELILTGNHQLRPIDVGVLLSGGITSVEVWRRPTVAIFPTGTELVSPEAVADGIEPPDGAIIESNSRMFEAMVNDEGGRAVRHEPLADDRALIREALDRAVDECDMVIVNAGSSAGTEDYTVHVLRELGEVIIHGVATKPGKPVILAVVRGKPVIGLPGYPVSAYIDFKGFVSPVLARMTGRSAATQEQAEAIISRRIVSSLKYREYVRVKVGRVDDRLIASPLARGAGAAMSLVRADGLCVVDQQSEGVEAGDRVSVTLWRQLSEIDKTVVCIGSHDMILDVIADLMPELHPGMHLSSAHVGSMGGLMALRRGEAHVSPTHLLDAETGVYNIPFLERLLPDEDVALVKGVGRVQGLIVPPGNPLGVRSIADLPGRRFINRQRGAGTRVLFDYMLGREGISTGEIVGYGREAVTHMAVAAAVKSGSADCGMGVLSAARAMGLDFVELAQEDYDFAIPRRFLALPHVAAFLEVLRGESFRERVARLGGYATVDCGKIIL